MVTTVLTRPDCDYSTGPASVSLSPSPFRWAYVSSRRGTVQGKELTRS